MLNQFLLLALVGLCFTSASAAEAVEARRTSKCSSVSKSLPVCAQVLKSSGICYISETKVVPLRAQMTSLIQALTVDGLKQQAPEQARARYSGNNDSRTLCSNARIRQITEDFSRFVSQLWDFSNRLRNVSDTDLQSLNEKKDTLIQQLRELQIFAGSQLTSSPTIVPSFEKQVSELDLGLSNSLSMLKSERPSRPPIDLKLLQKLPSPSSTSTSALVKSIATMYAGSLSNFDSTLEHVQSQSPVEKKLLGYFTLFQEMSKHSHLDTYELTRLLVQVKQAQVLLKSAPAALEAKYTQLKEDYAQFMGYFSGNQSCSIRSVALNRCLFTNDPGWPEYTLLRNLASEDNRMVLEPQNGGLTFRILYGNWIYATEGSTYSSSKRHIKRDQSTTGLPSYAWEQWKLVPVNKGKHFKILNAQHNEVMFVDPSETHTSDSYRRVFLKRYDYSGSVEMPANGDLWSLECA